MKRIFLVTLFLFSINITCIASEKTLICAKYQTNYSWSKGYKVEGTVITGSELNQATNSFNYNSLSTYVVIFWNQDQVSVIEMDFPYLSSLGQNGHDQQGRQWEIAKTSICF